MAKGSYVTPKIKELLGQIYVGNRQIRPGDAHRLLLNKMKAVHLDEIFGPSFPSISTVSKELKSLRQKDEARSSESQGLDEPWTIASVGPLSKYPIPAEAMPAVMAIYKKAPIVSRKVTPEGQVVYRTLESSRELTIREAQWIARLYKLIDDPDLLWDWAWFYAQQEWLAEVTGKSFFFPEFDLELMENPQWASNQRRDLEREIAIWDIAEKYNANPMKLKELNLSIKQTEKIAKSGKYKKEAQDEERHEARNPKA
jgi:hypothetical protein